MKSCPPLTGVCKGVGMDSEQPGHVQEAPEADPMASHCSGEEEDSREDFGEKVDVVNAEEVAESSSPRFFESYSSSPRPSLEDICTSSDTTEEPERIESDDESAAAAEQIIGAVIEKNSNLLSHDMVGFYAAALQYRLAASQADSQMQARAIAMSILETFVLPGAGRAVDFSPPVRKGLSLAHTKLAAFYGGLAYRSRPPRVVPDLFERAVREVRAQVRATIDSKFEEKLVQEQSRNPALTQSLLLDDDRFFGEELLLVQSKRLLASAASDKKQGMSTIRFEVPQAKTEDARKLQVDQAMSDWLNTGQATLRHVIKMSKTTQEPSKSTAELRDRAKIELKVASWAQSPQAKIEEQVLCWLSRDSTLDEEAVPSLERRGSQTARALTSGVSNTSRSQMSSSQKGALRRPLSARGTSSEVSKRPLSARGASSEISKKV